jgi:ribonuclease D
LQITLSNWEATHLSLEQIQYAARDAFATHHIHAALQRL